MQIILKEDVDRLGYKDDLVNVKDGYGRNYLIPQGKAILATATALKVREENLKQRAHKQAKEVEAAEAMLAELQKKAVKVGAKVGENGKIFGSVNTIQLADSIKKLGYDIDRKSLSIKNEPIKEVGTYEAEVAISRDVKGAIKFEVVEE